MEFLFFPKSFIFCFRTIFSTLTTINHRITIWTANKTAELVAADKLGRTVSLNEEFKPYNTLVRAAGIARLVSLALLALGAAAVLRRAMRRRADV